ncbi:hypothetical protein OJF2_53910 [Aquisphaera giovannonii]|uniref:Uncharacterized protein n=1 Tax=Aquisphaera giovannonii TaxID=406548 RepID=A0A5B9W7Z3_9BACT|nr:hypothetical protein [Aquisphaera giovannonii]QEH36806.1 hypothetical protein OJF2_53910 [Aquisphaera giovannonii]
MIRPVLLLSILLICVPAWASDGPPDAGKAVRKVAMKSMPPYGPYHVADPARHRSMPNPRGGDMARAMISLFRPVPPDRALYFAALDDDPGNDLYPRQGWWVYVRDVVPLPGGGWEAEVAVKVSFDQDRMTGPGFPQVNVEYIERYRFAGAGLEYLGGHAEDPTGLGPRIAVHHF